MLALPMMVSVFSQVGFGVQFAVGAEGKAEGNAKRDQLPPGKLGPFSEVGRDQRSKCRVDFFESFDRRSLFIRIIGPLHSVRALADPQGLFVSRAGPRYGLEIGC